MDPREPTPTMSIWSTGDPVPEAARLGGSFAQMIQTAVGDAWAGPWSEVDCRADDAALPEGDGIAGVIVTGSPARIADRSPWMLRTEDALRRLVAKGVPVFGICFGHQLLGMALGGRSGPNPLGREIGIVGLSTRGSDVLIGSEKRSFPVSMTHLDCILELPPAAQCLGFTDLDRHAAVRFGERTWGVQFHPEMDRKIIGAYITALRETLLLEDIDPEALLAACRDTPESAELLRRFALYARRLSNDDQLQFSRQQGVSI